MSPQIGSTRIGRPRREAETVSDASPRAQILDAAAALFAEKGFAATTTRAIAARVGIRQASLYYHFAGKDELLIELLTSSVRPSLQVVHRLEAMVPARATAAAALHALAVVDVETLLQTPHNIGTLYLLPEVADPRYDAFRRERHELQRTYGRLGRATASAQVTATVSEDRLGAILIQLAELVIQLRRLGETEETDAETIAATCLRACGLDDLAIQAASRDSATLLAGLPRRDHQPSSAGHAGTLHNTRGSDHPLITRG